MGQDSGSDSPSESNKHEVIKNNSDLKTDLRKLAIKNAMSSSIPGENNKRNKFNENEDEIEEDNNLKLKSKLSDQEKDDEEYNVPEEDISDEGTPSSKLE